MWTPRRILLALVGLLAFAAGYFGYSHVLGSFDGLPPLPVEYYPSDLPPPPPLPPTPSSLDRKLEYAFGANCPELRYPIKLEMKGRRIVIAARDFSIIKSGERTGWVEMFPLSVAALGEKRGADGIPEINAMYCDRAYLQFDKPIRNLSDLDGRTIVGAEMQADPDAPLSDARKGRIRLSNNRKTLDPNDDLEMVTPGPVYYEDEPKKGQPHIRTFAAVHVTDHTNTGLAEPDHTVPREPTVTGVGLRVYLTPTDKKKKGPPKKNEPRLPIPRKDTDPQTNGVDLIELDHDVEMNLWTDANASFATPGSSDKDGKKNPKKAVAKADGVDPKVDPKAPKKDKPVEKRLLTIRTNGPFHYDLTKELAHFEKPANPKPGLIEQVSVTRAGRDNGEDMLLCEYLDVQFQRKKPPTPDKDAPPKEDVPPKKDDKQANEGDLEIKSIRAWGETVVLTSDSDNMQATCNELTHDADAHITILKGDANQQVQAVKDGNRLRGSEIHLYGDGNEINQAHVLGAGSVGLGELDPKTGEFFKQAFWVDRMVFTREQVGKDQPPIDVITFLGKDGKRAKFRDTSDGQLQEIEADQLKVRLKPPDKKDDPKKDPKDPKTAKKELPKKAPIAKGDGKKEAPKTAATSAKPTRLEATGHVSTNTPDLIVKHSDYLDVVFKDVEELIKPPVDPKDDPKAKNKDPKSKDAKGPAVGEPKRDPMLPKVEAKEVGPMPRDAKDGPLAKKEEPKEEEQEKKPLIVAAKTIKCWVNRDPQGKTEMDHVMSAGDVTVHQDPANKDDLGTDIAGQTVEMQAYREGNRLIVTGTPKTDKAPDNWGVVRFDKLTMFGFHIVIDQRDNTSNIKGEGSMEIISNSDMEGKKLDKPTKMNIYWKHKMDFFGAEKLIYYHGSVQGYQEDSRLKCEWMQVLLDRPVYLNQDRKPKKAPKKLKPGEKAEDDNPNIDTVMCFYAPRDEEIPKPKNARPVTAIQEEKDEHGKLIKFQSVEGPDLVTIKTPLNKDQLPKDGEGPKSRSDMILTASDTMPGTVRLWQPGQKDALADKPSPKKDDPKKKEPNKVDLTKKEQSKIDLTKKDPPKKKGGLKEDEEMQLTIVQFAGKMIANDFRKRAKFFNNVRTVHLPADSPTIPVDLREGDIPLGAVYLDAKDTLDVFSTEQMEKDPESGKMVSKAYQEMIAIGSVHVRKQGEFIGDADKVTYSELKGTLTFHGTLKNPAVVMELRGQGIKGRTHSARIVIYYTKTKTFESIDAIGVSQ
ncbi:MAG TPA: hypothetical protein VHR66_15475 [Gemmataceae bacterium]|nr:hypothetical protein [Gemmataceae bacterium]